MKLQAALGASLMFIRGPATPEIGAAWAKALEIAESLGDAEFQLQSLRGLWFFHLTGGRQRAALEVAERFCTLAASSSEPLDRLLGEQMLGASEFHLGNLSTARGHLERVLAAYVASDRGHIIHFEANPRVMARVYFARTLWLQGLAEQAMRSIQSSVEDARVGNHVNSLGYALNGACMVALWVGDLDAACEYVAMLLDHPARHSPISLAVGRIYRDVLVVRRGDVVTGVRQLRADLNELGEATTISRFKAFFMAEALGRGGQIAEGLEAIEDAIERSERDEERWATAELLRVKGELLLLQGESECLAKRQDALSWELRAATGLAQLWRDQGRSAEAMGLLRPVYDRFTEGFETADLKAAKALLDAL
jgi:tetratricopeptide (TPR) repeat protein